MTKQEKILQAKETRINELLALNGRGGLEILRLDDDHVSVRRVNQPILVSQGEAMPRMGRGIYWVYDFPAGYPLEAKPIVSFPEPEHTPWSPNVFESGYACLGNVYSTTTLLYLTRKILLESILDPNTVNPSDAANSRMRDQYQKIMAGIANVSFTLPLASPQEIYRLIPEVDGERYRRPACRTAVLASENAAVRRRPRMG